MSFQYFRVSIFVLFTSLLLTQCSKTSEITYDVYFWSDSIDKMDEQNALFIDGIEKGSLTNPLIEVDCNAETAILEQLIFQQLSNGIHEVEVRNRNGLVRTRSSIEINYNGRSKSLGLASGGTSGRTEINGNDECLIVKISF